MREYVATAKTVEEAIQLGCEALSVDRDDLGVSYEILEMPQKTGFLGLKVTCLLYTSPSPRDCS